MTIYTTDYLSEINQLLASPLLDLNSIKNLYHNILLENAMYVIMKYSPHKVYKYVEEFLANSIYLLEMQEENDARVQLQAAKEILLHVQ